MTTRRMTCLGCARLVLYQPDGYCPPCRAVYKAAGQYHPKP